MKKTVITFGIIAGLAVAGLMYLTMPMGKEKMDFDMGQTLGYISMTIAMSTIFFAVKAYRDKHNNGKVSFGRAFLVGLYITLIAAAIYAVAWEIYYRTAASGFMDQYAAYYIEKMKSEGASPQEIQAQTDQMNTMKEWYQYTAIRFIMTVFELLPVGLVISFLSAAILRKKEVSPA